MFTRPGKSLFEQLDVKVNGYLVALAYVQSSLKLSEHEKTVFFTIFDDVSADISTSIEQLKRSGINVFNRAEVEEYLHSSLPVIMAEIDRELRKIAKAVRYDPSAAMPVEAAIEALTRSMPGRPSVAADRIGRLFAYRTLFDESPEAAKTEAEKPREEESGRFDRAMEEIRLKAFLEMLRGASDRNPEYFFKANSFVTRQMTDAVIPYVDALTSVEGLSYAASGTGSINIRFRSAEVLMDYTVRMATDPVSFTVTITGFVNRSGARVDFSVSGKYPVKLQPNVINSFGLGRLIEKHRESELEFRNAHRERTADERNAKKTVDDFFNS